MLLALAFAAAAAAAATITVPDLSEAEVRAAMVGLVPTRSESFKTATGKSAGRGIGAIVIERPVADVWATLMHYEDRAEYVPRLKSVTLLEKQPARLRIRQEIDATVTTARYTAWFDLDEKAHEIRWTLDRSAPDNTVSDVEGGYRMVEVAPRRTLLVYRTYVDTGHHVPKFVQSYMQEKSIPDLLKAIKRRVESGGQWRKK